MWGGGGVEVWTVAGATLREVCQTDSHRDLKQGVKASNDKAVTMLPPAGIYIRVSKK